MFQQIKSLLGATGEIQLTIRADGDKMKVVLIAKSADAKSEIALNQPLVMCETADVLDAGFVEAIQAFAATRSSLIEQVQATNTILKEAEKAQVKKTATRTTSKPGASTAKPSVVSDAKIDDAGGDDDDGESSSDTGTVTLPASNASTTTADPAPVSNIADLSLF